MIAGIFHSGSGTGNQLHRYLMTRVLALDKNYEFSMVYPQNFKGYSFLNIDFGMPLEMSNPFYFIEKRVNDENGVDIRDYDWSVHDIADNTVIDGEFQGELYYEHHREYIDKWLKVTPLDLSDNLCVIGFRGGEYSIFPDLFLTEKYWDDAIKEMRRINPKVVFKVVTDDPDLAQLYFPNFEITHDIGRDWRHVRYAKYLILANSSFFILPAWLNQKAHVIAPWGWARHNLGFWALEQNKMKGWHYLKTDGTFETFN